MLPEEKYYKELLLAIYPCKVPFTVAVKHDKPRKRLGTYYPKTKRIIIHTGWKETHNCTETAIHEFAHHIHHTEFKKQERKQKPHGKAFWQIYGQLIWRAKAIGVFEDDRLPVLTFPEAAAHCEVIDGHRENRFEDKPLSCLMGSIKEISRQVRRWMGSEFSD